MKKSPTYEYTAIFNGFAMEMCYGDLEALQAMPGVKSAYVATRYEAPSQWKRAWSL